MTSWAIQIEGLSKVYDLGLTHQKFFTRRLSGVLGSRLSRAHGGSDEDESFVALNNLSFEIQRGEVFGILGRNGAGKSTLLKILSQITKPTAGRIEIRGRVGSLLEVGTGFHPELTGRENVFLNGAILGMSKKEVRRKFDEIVEFSGVEKFIDTPVKRFSSGMNVRLGFAVAAHLEPEILLIDEVLAVGDAEFQKKCLKKIKSSAETGRTVVFVSHNMAAVSQFCQRSAWIEAGRVSSIGASASVVKAYLSQDSCLTSERSWSHLDAPGDDLVRLSATRILQDRSTTSVVDINSSCEIEIDFFVMKEIHNLVTGISMYDDYGTCVFASCDWRENQFSPGHFRKSVTIPAQTLAEGQKTILVQLVFYEPDKKSAVVPEALRFDTVDSCHPSSVRGHYKGEWPGAVRLALPWSDAETVRESINVRQ